MTLAVTHTKVEAIADDPTAVAAGQVVPSDWNAAHTLTGTMSPAQGGTGTSTAFTAGSVIFAGASGVYSQDNAKLFWDDTNNYLGVNKATPAVELDVVGSVQVTATASSNALYVRNSQAGYVSRFENVGGVDCYNAFRDNTPNQAEYGLWSASLYFQIVNGCVNGIQFLELSSSTPVGGSVGGIFLHHNNSKAVRILAGTKTNPAAAEIYNTYTDASNYERATVNWQSVSNVLTIGTEAAGTGTARGLRFTVGNVSMLGWAAGSWTFGSAAVLFAGTTSNAALKFSTGSLLTTPAVGAMEFDGVALYQTSVASARQVVNAEQVQVLSANRTFTNNTSAQAIFNATTNGAITLAAATTYEFEMLVAASGFSSSAHTINIGFAGTATLTGIGYFYDAQAGTTLATPGASLTGFIAAATATAVIASATTTGLVLRIRGTVRINAGGTFIPQLTQVTASAAAIVQANSFFRCWPIGSNTVASVGNWS